jgi:hypothetical protein
VGDHDVLLGQIRALLTSSARDREQIERTLTDGYAHALSLEAERLRVEQKLRGLAGTSDRGDLEKNTREMSELARWIEHQDVELSELRQLLTRLRVEYYEATAASAGGRR